MSSRTNGVHEMSDLDVHRRRALVRLLVLDQQGLESVGESDELVLAIVEGGLLEREVKRREGQLRMGRMCGWCPVLGLRGGRRGRRQTSCEC